MIESNGKYTYDALYRLLKATGRERVSLSAPGAGGYDPDFVNTNGRSSQSLSTYCQQYTYDALGNILELSHRDTCGGTENWKRTYVYNTNTPNNYLQSAYTGSTPPSSPQFTYDAHGNMREMPHLSSMNWDFTDQLKSTEKTGETTYYIYSGGERIRKVCMNTSTNKIKHERIYLGGYEIYRKYDANEDLVLERTTNKVMDDKRMIALLEVKTFDGTPVGSPVTITRYQYTNHLDSASLELNENAEIISYEEYHPFGSTSYALHTNDSEVSLKRYKYVHKERDEETGLYYYGARYYAAWLCRFVSVDPLKDDYFHLTPYNNASNRPIGNVDVDGMQSQDEITSEEKFKSKIDGFNAYGMKIKTPDDETSLIPDNAIPFLNAEGQTIGFIGYGGTLFLYINNEKQKGYIDTQGRHLWYYERDYDNYQEAKSKGREWSYWLWKTIHDTGSDFIELINDPIGYGKSIYSFLKDIDIVSTFEAIQNLDDETQKYLLASIVVGATTANPKRALWSVGKETSAIRNAIKHWQKHRHEFPEFTKPSEYVRAAHRFLWKTPSGTQVKLQGTGDVIFWNKDKNLFASMTMEGTPKTFFKPNLNTINAERLSKGKQALKSLDEWWNLQPAVGNYTFIIP